MKNRIAEYLPGSWFKRERAAAPDFSWNVRSLQAWTRPVEELVTRHPGTSLVVAFAAGVAIAWWLKRR
jgi:hypothetical protein